jgi:hypothetical protein
MVANPFFCLKIGHFKTTVRTVAHPSMEKQVLQIQRILLRLCVYFPDFGISRWGGCDMPRSQCRTNNGTNCQHSPSCFLCELLQVCDPFFGFRGSGSSRTGWVTLALAYPRRHRRRVVAKSAESGDLVFTLMDALLYGPQHKDGGFLNRKMGGLPFV